MEDDKKLSYFFLGLGIGIAAGVLFAPKSGEETREFLRDKAGEGKDFIKRRGEELRDTASEYVEKSRTTISRQKDQFAAAVEAGKAAYREAVVNPEEKTAGAEGV